jgi:hypothetical protein
VEARFRALYETQFSVVREYYSAVKEAVEIVDLKDFVPAFRDTDLFTESLLA